MKTNLPLKDILAILFIVWCVWSLRNFIAAKHAQAQEPPLHFSFRLPDYKVTLQLHAAAPSGYWQLTGRDTEYKNVILRTYQDMLSAIGIPRDKQRLFAAQLYHENGAMTVDRIGDHGCSFGLVQYNACSHKGMSARRFLQQHPEWLKVETQLAWMVDQVKTRQADYSTVAAQIIDHNCPFCVSPKASAKWRAIGQKYYNRVLTASAELSLL